MSKTNTPRNGHNRITHSDHNSRKEINKKTQISAKKEDPYGEIPRKIAKICGVKNLDRASLESVNYVMNVYELVLLIQEQTEYKIREILQTISDIKRRDTLKKKRNDRFKIIGRKLTSNYLGDDFLLDADK